VVCRNMGRVAVRGCYRLEPYGGFVGEQVRSQGERRMWQTHPEELGLGSKIGKLLKGG